VPFYAEFLQHWKSRCPILLSNNSLPVCLHAFVSMWNEADDEQTDWILPLASPHILMLQSDSFLQHAFPQPVNPRKGYRPGRGREPYRCRSWQMVWRSDRTARRWIERYLVSGKTSRRAGTGFWHVSSQRTPG
jgi:hypothetical protein